MNVRRATHADIYAIARIHRTAIHSASAFYTPEQIASWAANIVPEAYLPYIATSEFFVAVDGVNGVVGFASLDRNNSELASVYVDPEHMRRGAGRMLIAAIDEAARTSGVARIDVTASLNAMPFYRAVGYTLLEHTTSRTRDGVEMACARMRKEL